MADVDYNDSPAALVQIVTDTDVRIDSSVLARQDHFVVTFMQRNTNLCSQTDIL